MINSCKGSCKGNNIDFGDDCLCLTPSIIFREMFSFFVALYDVGEIRFDSYISRLIHLRRRVRSKPLAKISKFLNIKSIGSIHTFFGHQDSKFKLQKQNAHAHAKKQNFIPIETTITAAPYYPVLVFPHLAISGWNKMAEGFFRVFLIISISFMYVFLVCFVVCLCMRSVWLYIPVGGIRFISHWIRHQVQLYRLISS